MHLFPTPPLAFFNCLSGVIEPSFVEPNAISVGVRHPRKLRNRICQRAQFSFTGFDSFLRPLFFRKIPCDADKTNRPRFAAIAKINLPSRRHPTHCPIWPDNAKLNLVSPLI